MTQAERHPNLGRRVNSSELVAEAINNPDKEVDEQFKGEVAKVSKTQGIMLFSEGLLIHDGNKTKAFLHAGMDNGRPRDRCSILASKYYNRHKVKIQSFLRGEFNNTMLSKVGNAMKTVTRIMEDEDGRHVDRLKAAEMVVKWANMDSTVESALQVEEEETLIERKQRMKALLGKAIEI